MDAPTPLREFDPAPDPCSPGIAAVKAVIARHQGRPGALLPILHAIEHDVGYIPPESVTVIAAALNLSRAEVHGVITFYPHFHTVPPATHTIEVCQAESCQAMGSDRLTAHAQERLGCALHSHTPDGRYALMPVYCLGLCAQSPSVMIDGRPHARVSPEKLDRLVAALEGATP